MGRDIRAIDPGHLNDVRTLADVLELLGDYLDWPVETDDIDDASFEYSPEELGIPEERLPRLTSIKQLRPLTTGQPWGIFFLEFEGPRLPITPLRQLLKALVTRKRQGAAGDRRTWDLQDLLFIITTTDQTGVELHLVAFENTDDGAAQIFSLPWRPGQSPPQHLRRLAEELLPRLSWPEDAADVSGWRASWHTAFALRPGAAIRNAKALAERMASVAQEVRRRIESALAAPAEDEPLLALYDEVREQLVADLGEYRFADVCAQTLVYGLLSSRVADPIGFGASPVLAVVPLANPFLDAFFERIHDRLYDAEDEDGLATLIADLRATDVEAIVDQFGATARGADPVIHFYEEFLKAYDPALRAEAGAFYTPQPVVDYIVRSVDEALRTTLLLPDGLADSSTWAEVASRLDIEVPDDVDADAPFLRVLDPATGTGTFLVEVMRRARKSFLENDGDPAEWPERLNTVVLPSIGAFELMPGPYAIAHLKIAMEAHAEGVREARPSILLTDALEHPDPGVGQAVFDPLQDPVAFEGAIADSIKAGPPFPVMVGNPPYRRLTRDEAGGWVVHGRDESDRSLFDEILDRANASVIFSEVASLYNLYIYFWRWALWATFERHRSTPAVLSFITASSWLRGGAFVGLREQMLENCDEIWITDLGGEAQGAHPEENVFEIQTPVAIATLVRRGDGAPGTPARVWYRRVTGSREEKFSSLEMGPPARASDEWIALHDAGAESFVPQRLSDAWLAMPPIQDLFPWQQPGAMLNRTWTVAPRVDVLMNRWGRFVADPSPAERARLFPDPGTGRKVTTTVRGRIPLVDEPTDSDPPDQVEYGWRPFDRQLTFDDPRLAKTESPSLWQARGDHQLFLATLVIIPIGPGPSLVAYTDVPDKAAFRGSFGGKDILPLYRGPDRSSPNLPAELSGVLQRSIRLKAPPSPEDIASYIFALLSSPAYEQVFRTELGERVARVPITAHPDIWSDAVELGRSLLVAATDGRWNPTSAPIDLITPCTWTALPTTAPSRPRAIGYDEESATLTVGDGILTGVPREVWDYKVSGWPVLQRWLESRSASGRGKKSSDLDDIRFTDWLPEWSTELLSLVSRLHFICEAQPRQAELLTRVLENQLVPTSDLPQPTDAERQVPATDRAGGGSANEKLF
jgi:hypothetical protein